MLSKEELKRKVCAAIDARRDHLVRLGETIQRNPETGFNEHQTAALVAQEMERLGLAPQTGLALTGVKGRLAGGKAGPTLAVLGELDSLTVSDHPLAHPETGAAHACGHNAQVTGMLGVAMGLKESGALEHLAGSLVFMAVPAEELIEVEQRLDKVAAGQLEFLLGKQELIRLGHFDDVDLVTMFHAASGLDTFARMMDSSNGALVKKIRFAGRAAHAGSTPHLGINALNAATIALAAIQAQRETFREEDTIRIHPIITKGGDAVSVVPAEVKVETFVRGRTIEAIQDANRKVDRSLRAGALAMGCEVEIQTIPAYLPQHNNADMGRLFEANVAEMIGPGQFPIGGHKTGSTDLGDVGHLLPVLYPNISGSEGATHSAAFQITDPDRLYVTSAKLLAMTAVDLLYDDAREAKGVLDRFQPSMTKDAYLKHQRSLFHTERFSGAEA